MISNLQRSALLSLVMALAISALAADSFPMRTWTSRSGKTTEGSFVGVSKRSLMGQQGQHLPPELRVILQRRDGTRIAIALRELSAPDRHYVVKCSDGPAAVTDDVVSAAASPTAPPPPDAGTAEPPTAAPQLPPNAGTAEPPRLAASPPSAAAAPPAATASGRGLARDALTAAMAKDPEINLAAYLAILDAMAAELRPRIAGKTEPAEIAADISAYVFEEQKFAYDESVHFLHDALDMKRGSSIGLSVLYVALAQAVGVPAAPIRLPRSLLVRIHAGEAVVNVDMRNKGGQASDAALIQEYGIPAVSLERGCYLTPLTDRRLVGMLFLAIGDMFQKEGATEEALLAYNRSISLDEKNAEAYQIRARYSMSLARYGAAMRDCEAAFRLNPLYGTGPDTLRTFPWPGADWDELLRQLDKVVEDQPGDWGAQGLRGILYSWRGFPALGMLSLNEALDMNPYSTLCRLTRAKLRTDIGARDGALADLRHALETAPHLRAYVAGLGGFSVWHTDPDYLRLIAASP